MSATSSPATSANPQASALLMYATYAVGAVGLFWGFATVLADPASLRWACLIAVGFGGLISFVRHSIFHRSDAARMNWDLGRRNNFQIEVGLANLAWGLVATLAAVLDWGLAVQSAMFLTFGIYLVSVGAMQLFWPGDHEGDRRSVGPMISLGSFGILLTVLGILGMNAAA